MATIRDVVLTFGEVPPRSGHVTARVSGQIDFDREEIAEEKLFRLSVELRASDTADEGFWPFQPLHTFHFGEGILFTQPYRVVRAHEEPVDFTVENELSMAQLDEDPGTEERAYTEAGPDGRTYTVIGTFTKEDEVYAQALLASVPGESAQSDVVAVPWSDRRVPG